MMSKHVTKFICFLIYTLVTCLVLYSLYKLFYSFRMNNIIIIYVFIAMSTKSLNKNIMFYALKVGQSLKKLAHFINKIMNKTTKNL